MTTSEKKIEKVVVAVVCVSFVISAVIGLVMFANWAFEEKSKPELEFELYLNARKVCGSKENVQRNDYTSGRSDFQCVDYSKAHG